MTGSLIGSLYERKKHGLRELREDLPASWVSAAKILEADMAVELRAAELRAMQRRGHKMTTLASGSVTRIDILTKTDRTLSRAD